jgi:hypothetical protein
LQTTGTLAMKNLPNAGNPYTYAADGISYTTAWTGLSNYQDYSVDLGTTSVHVPYSGNVDAYTNLTNESNSLMVMPQTTILGAFSTGKGQGTATEKNGSAQASYLSATIAEVDPTTQAVANERTIYFLIPDAYASNVSIVFEAGRQYTFRLTLSGTDGTVFESPLVSDFNSGPNVVFPHP